MTPAAELIISRRFCGPPASGNGGYTCGMLARHLGRPARVRLHAPPPLDRPLTVEREDSQLRLLDGSTIIATAVAASLTMVPPPAPTLAQARAASVAYAGFFHHGFPACFVCGPQRLAGDGLRVFAGPLSTPGSTEVAAPFVPPLDAVDARGHLHEPFVWAALDCPGYFAVCRQGDRKMLLGEMSLACLQPAIVAEPDLLVYAWPEGREGRKHHAGSALANAQGKILAVARAVWIEPREDAA